MEREQVPKETLKRKKKKEEKKRRGLQQTQNSPRKENNFTCPCHIQLTTCLGVISKNERREEEGGKKREEVALY